MKFGEYLKNLREQHKWTQPQASEKINIEQSYLSKLETGKSYPSEEIFERLKHTYQFEVANLTNLFDAQELQKLSDIHDIRKLILRSQHSEKKAAKRWLVGALVSLLLGGFFLGSAIVSQQQVETHYYTSHGILQQSEFDDAFNIATRPQFSAVSFPERSKEQSKMLIRLDVLHKVTDKYKHERFTTIEDTGRRVFFKTASRIEPRFLNGAYFLIPALMGFLACFMCIFISFKWK